LENEVGDNIRGAPKLHRVVTPVEERNYTSSLCPLIQVALEHGAHSIVPERGIRYTAYNTGKKFDYGLIVEGMEKPGIALLNTAKNECSWSIYYPFTLSISDPQLLYEFVRGRVFIVVATDFATFEKSANERGFGFELLNDSDYAVELVELNPHNSEPLTVRISRGFFARISFEFLSWEWVLDNELANIDKYKALAVGHGDA
jgi:hypothetical protein